MVELARLTYLKPARSADDAFLYDVFATTWADEVAALPNQSLARHVLRIQHTAQERRFDLRYPGLRRFVVSHEGERAGRLYLFGSGSTLHLVDLTLLPPLQSLGIGSRVLGDLMREASSADRRMSMRVGRDNERSLLRCTSLGFDLVSSDDLGHYLEWVPASASVVERTSESSHSVP